MFKLLSKLLLASIGLVSTLADKLLGLNKRDVSTVENIDLTRYAGRWYEIARLPNFFEKADMRDITADYELLPSGEVSVHNSSRRGDGRETEVFGVARVTDESNAKLKVAFAPKFLRVLPFVWGDYWILSIDSQYQWALVGEPGRKFFWILSRQPFMPEDQYEALCEKALEKGFDISKLIRPEQSDG